MDELKLDGCFVAGVPESHEDRAITSAAIDLAHGLGMLVVAEGVEYEPQREFLGCAWA